MRTVLALSLALTLLVVSVALSGRSAAATRGRPLSVLVSSRGHLRPPVLLPGGGEAFDDAVALGDLLLTHDGSAGLWVARLDPGLEFAGFERFDTARDPAAADALLHLEREAAPGSLWVLTVRGRVAPREGAASVEQLDRVPRRLGAATSPFRVTTSSWALIAMRRAAGWVTLAEAYSSGHGVQLAFTVDPDPERYAHHRSTPAFATGRPSDGVDLGREVGTLAESSGTVLYVKWTQVGGVMHHGVMLHPLEDGVPARATWDDLRVTQDAALRASLALTEESWTASDGAEFRVLVDGVPVYSWTCLEESAGLWEELDLDLSPWAGRTVSLTLEVDPLGSHAGDWALFGTPRLVFLRAGEDA